MMQRLSRFRLCVQWVYHLRQVVRAGTRRGFEVPTHAELPQLLHVRQVGSRPNPKAHELRLRRQHSWWA